MKLFFVFLVCSVGAVPAGCKQNLLHPLFSKWIEGPATAIEPTKLMLDICPKQTFSCCSDDQLKNLFENVVKASTQHVKFLTNIDENQKLWSIESKQSIFSTYLNDKITPECLPPKEYHSYQVFLTKEAVTQPMKKSKKIIGSFICEACSPAFGRVFTPKSEPFDGVNFNFNSTQHIQNALLAYLPLFSYVDGKYNHMQSIKCEMSKNYNPKFIDHSGRIKELLIGLHNLLEIKDKQTLQMPGEMEWDLNYYVRIHRGVNLDILNPYIEELKAFATEHQIPEEKEPEKQENDKLIKASKPEKQPAENKQAKEVNKSSQVVTDKGTDGKTSQSEAPKLGHPFEGTPEHPYSVKYLFIRYVPSGGLDFVNNYIHDKHCTFAAIAGAFLAGLLALII